MIKAVRLGNFCESEAGVLGILEVVIGDLVFRSARLILENDVYHVNVQNSISQSNDLHWPCLSPKLRARHDYHVREPKFIIRSAPVMVWDNLREHSRALTVLKCLIERRLDIDHGSVYVVR